MDQDATWKRTSAQAMDIVLDVDPAPPKGVQSPQFSAHDCCGQTDEWIKMPIGTEVGLGPGHIVLDGDPPLRKGAQPPFSAYGYCGQTARWIKMPLVTEVGLGPGHIVLDRDPAPPRQRGSAPNFRPMSIVAK